MGIDGRLTSRSYENQEGKKVKVVELVANEVEFLETKSGGNQGGNQGGNPNQYNDYGYQDQGGSYYPPDDDLPFGR